MKARKFLVKKTIIQIVVFFVLLAAVEGTARLIEKTNPRSAVDLQLYLQPYMMFATGGPYTGEIWQDIFKKRSIPSSISTNNLGFIESFDFELIPDSAYLASHRKQSGERLVLLTGGSVVHGAGATKNENTIASRLMYHLNEKSNGVRYRVINMGMGSWIAYQQFIGLSLFGLPLDPDWIVVMDGHNDGVVPCLHGSGAGNPMAWPKLLYTSYGTGERQTNSPLMVLARHSALVRWISGLQPDQVRKDRRDLVFDETDTDKLKRFQIKLAGVTTADQVRQVDFYLNAQRNVLNLFHRANVMMSTQPLYWDNGVSRAYRNTFASGGADFGPLKSDLDGYMGQHVNESCEVFSKIQASGMLGYFMGQSAVKLAELAADEQKLDPSRHILYQNVEGALPYDEKLRASFFIDNAHLSDLGQDRVGEFFADNILAAERGTKFDFAAFATHSAAIAAAHE